MVVNIVHMNSCGYLQPTLVHKILKCGESGSPVDARCTSVIETRYLCWQCGARVLRFEVSLEIGKYFVGTTIWSSVLVQIKL